MNFLPGMISAGIFTSFRIRQQRFNRSSQKKGVFFYKKGRNMHWLKRHILIVFTPIF
jgi:hypothetical protein